MKAVRVLTKIARNASIKVSTTLPDVSKFILLSLQMFVLLHVSPDVADYEPSIEFKPGIRLKKI